MASQLKLCFDFEIKIQSHLNGRNYLKMLENILPKGVLSAVVPLFFVFLMKRITYSNSVKIQIVYIQTL